MKYIGIYTCFLCGYLLVQDYWRLLPNKALTDRQLLADCATRVTVLTLVPAAFYLGLFWLHFSILTKVLTFFYIENIFLFRFKYFSHNIITTIFRLAPMTR